MLAPRDSKNRQILLGLIGQSLPDMTEDEMESWIQHPEGLPAVVAGLKNPPQIPAGVATAPLHVGSPPRAVGPEGADIAASLGIVEHPAEVYQNLARNLTTDLKPMQPMGSPPD